MEEWDADLRPVRGAYNLDAVEHCTTRPEWRNFRMRLKSQTTANKLTLLAEWYDGNFLSSQANSKWEREVQVGDYLRALRRGGQLDQNNRVKH